MFADDNPPFTTFKEFVKKLEEKRVGLNKATSMGEAILSICHPDSITTIKHWNTIIKARFEEVSTQLLAGKCTFICVGLTERIALFEIVIYNKKNSCYSYYRLL